VAQFDVYKNPAGGTYPLLLEIQSDLLQSLATRMVVPLAARKKYAKPTARLHPTAMIAGVEYVMLFHDMASVPTSVLAHRVGSLASRRADLIAALDLLFTGA